MLEKDFVKYHNDVTSKALDLHTTKTLDYATEDVNSNFKRISSAVKALEIDTGTPYGYALTMVLVKIDRLNNIMKHNKKPKHESIDDTVIDGVNYIIFAGSDVKEILSEHSEED